MSNGIKTLINPTIVPVPLADGTAAFLHLPQTLGHADADKIARVVKAMAVDTWPTRTDSAA